MKIINVKQGSPEWLSARMGVPTASELSNLVTPLWKLRTGETPNSYFAKKLAEKWIGEPIHSWSGGSMEQGSVLEDEALPWLAFDLDAKLERPGFITTDGGEFGCSPDAWLPERRLGIELKCPEVHTHTKWLLAGGLPPDHAAQVQGSMYAAGTSEWLFVSYCRRMPPLVVLVSRDPAAQKAITDAVDWFQAELESGWRRLVALNGGAEPRPLAEVEEEAALSF